MPRLPWLATALWLLSACGSTPLGIVRADGGPGPGADAGPAPGSDGGPAPGSDGGPPPGADGGPGPGADGGPAPGVDGGPAPGADGGPGPADGGGTLALGAACADPSSCGADGFCLTEQASGFPGGYCSASCATGPCPQGGVCYGRFQVCLQPCQAGSCRPGYTCAQQIGNDTLPAPACIPGSPGASIGDACQNSGACPPGGFCITQESTGFPGGYCSRPCRPNTADCGAGATCVDLGGEIQPFCVRTCERDDQCRSGYVCERTWFGENLAAPSCVPGTRAPVAVGAACSHGGDCPPSWFCLGRDDGFPGGYCTRLCEQNSQCGGDAFCDSRIRLCLDGCRATTDCREGYACHNRISGFMTSRSTCVAFTAGARVGDPCGSFADCTLGGFCIQPVDENGDPTGFTGGYCSATCGLTMACPQGSFCQTFGMDGAICIDECAGTSDCRQDEGYVCRSGGAAGTRMGCFPGGG